MRKLAVSALGPIKQASVEFGNLTVLVGPQATGKSLFLQLAKLVVDGWPIRNEFKRFNIDWGGKLESFLDLYFGEGMSAIYEPKETVIEADGGTLDLNAWLKKRPKKEEEAERTFFIPAQRVMTLREGLTWPFQSYRFGDPFVLREFSERLHNLMQSEFGRSPELFPKANRLKKEFRDLLGANIFGGFGLGVDLTGPQKRIVLSSPDGKNLPFLVWSAGQREFVPLLLGLYWLMPPAAVARRDQLEWVVIEEPEMGLHANAISVVMALVLELLHRGYKVCLSTHSPHILDVVWALQTMKTRGGKEEDVRSLFQLPAAPQTKKLAKDALTKDYRVYYFQRTGEAVDISALDPGSEVPGEAGWGGLSEFSGNVGDIVARVVARDEPDGVRP